MDEILGNVIISLLERPKQFYDQNKIIIDPILIYIRKFIPNEEIRRNKEDKFQEQFKQYLDENLKFKNKNIREVNVESGRIDIVLMLDNSDVKRKIALELKLLKDNDSFSTLIGQMVRRVIGDKYDYSIGVAIDLTEKNKYSIMENNFEIPEIGKIIIFSF